MVMVVVVVVVAGDGKQCVKFVFFQPQCFDHNRMMMMMMIFIDVDNFLAFKFPGHYIDIVRETAVCVYMIYVHMNMHISCIMIQKKKTKQKRKRKSIRNFSTK